MSWLDALFVIFLIIGAVRGILTGKMVPLLIIFAVWVTSIAIAVNFEGQLGSTIGDYAWAPLLAFFIIFGIIQIVLWGSGIPLMIRLSISWVPQRWLDVLGGAVITTCITAIVCGIVWRILEQIAWHVFQGAGFPAASSTGGARVFYDLVQDSAVRGGLTAFVDWFAPPVGVILGAIVGAGLVALGIVGRMRGQEVDMDEVMDRELALREGGGPRPTETRGTINDPGGRRVGERRWSGGGGGGRRAGDRRPGDPNLVDRRPGGSRAGDPPA